MWLDERNARRLVSVLDDFGLDPLANKKPSGRPQDIADVAVIEEQLGNG